MEQKKSRSNVSKVENSVHWVPGTNSGVPNYTYSMHLRIIKIQIWGNIIIVCNLGVPVEYIVYVTLKRFFLFLLYNTILHGLMHASFVTTNAEYLAYAANRSQVKVKVARLTILFIGASLIYRLNSLTQKMDYKNRFIARKQCSMDRPG